MYDYGVSLSTRFPQKLWKIVNECKTDAIQWSLNGATILLNYKKFHDEYLTPPYSVFKTNNITSFIRQLNLYGFRKVTSHNCDPSYISRNPDIHEFIHGNFHRDRVDLLSRVYRKSSGKKRYEKINEKLLSRNKIINKNESTHGMSRLQICQLALKEALKQAVEEYLQKKVFEKLIYIERMSKEKF